MFLFTPGSEAPLFSVWHLGPQDMAIEVDENGTLDLSMKRCKENGKAQSRTPPEAPLSPPESAVAKGGSVLIGPAFYQPLCERDSWESSLPVHFSKAHILQDKEVTKYSIRGDLQKTDILIL